MPELITGYSGPSTVLPFLVRLFWWSNEISEILPRFPDGSDGEEAACNAEELDSVPGWGRSPQGTEWQSTPVFLPGESYGQRSLVDYNPWRHKESDTIEWLTLWLWLTLHREENEGLEKIGGLRPHGELMFETGPAYPLLPNPSPLLFTVLTFTVLKMFKS